jgi:hypothetical protein
MSSFRTPNPKVTFSDRQPTIFDSQTFQKPLKIAPNHKICFKLRPPTKEKFKEMHEELEDIRRRERMVSSWLKKIKLSKIVGRYSHVFSS